ncbi:MAG: trypsin-like peptidase domain-containing protein [Candidatus Brockarchaeota archaeon]|nr:trypsin-like peptidase domain-containing protein [Candidatus Brockarchaeota archaeon]
MPPGNVSKITAAYVLALTIVSAVFGYGLLSVQQTILLQKEEIGRLNENLRDLERQVSALTEAVQSRSPEPSVDLAELYSRVRGSIVVVQGVVVQRIFTIFGPVLQYSKVQGSGFVCSSTGRNVIVTNYHVVNQVQNLTVSFYNGDAFDAVILGSDPYSDLAVLAISASEVELEPLVLGSSSSLRVGDFVIAIGNPLGLAGSMTTGIVSQLGRTIQESTTGGYMIANVIQTSAPINPGNSGGPLLNSIGEVVGITTAIVSGSQGVGLAIPSDTIRRELPYLITLGKYDMHSWMGVGGMDVTPDVAKALKLSKSYGWLVTSVTPGGPAEKAGIRAGTRQVAVSGTTVTAGGDVIIALNGTRIRGGDDLSAFLEARTLPGQTLEVTVLRDGEEQTLTLVLGKRPPPG